MGSDVSILQALADPERYTIVRALLSHDATQKELGEQLGLSSGVMSRHMGHLESLGLVYRERSHGPYELLFRQQVWHILQGAADLASDRSAQQARLDQEAASELRKLGMRGRPGSARERRGG
jgi:DNA-binding MarR family transcriptional regulator